MWLSPRLIPATTSSSMSTRTTVLPPCAKARASGIPTYPAPTIATSGFIAGEGYRRRGGATLRIRLGPLAQLVEQGTLNPKVVGSIPTRPILNRLTTRHPHDYAGQVGQVSRGCACGAYL